MEMKWGGSCIREDKMMYPTASTVLRHLKHFLTTATLKSWMLLTKAQIFYFSVISRPGTQISMPMIIIANTLLSIVLQKFDPAVHQHRRASDIKSGISSRFEYIIRHPSRHGITNAVNLRYKFDDVFVRLTMEPCVADQALPICPAQKAGNTVVQTVRDADP